MSTENVSLSVFSFETEGALTYTPKLSQEAPCCGRAALLASWCASLGPCTCRSWLRWCPRWGRRPSGQRKQWLMLLACWPSLPHIRTCWWISTRQLWGPLSSHTEAMAFRRWDQELGMVILWPSRGWRSDYRQWSWTQSNPFSVRKGNLRQLGPSHNCLKSRLLYSIGYHRS